jgi:hypothetical protein
MVFKKLIKRCFTSKPNYKFFDVHFFEYYPSVNKKSLPTAFLLTESINIFNYTSNVEHDVQNIKLVNEENSTLWGIKNEGNEFSVEYYFYFKKKYQQNALENLKRLFGKYTPFDFDINQFNNDYFLVSINPVNSKIKGFNIYYSVINNNYPVHYLEDLGFTTNFSNAVETSLYFDFETNKIHKGNTYNGIASSSELSLLYKTLNDLSNKLFPCKSIDLIYQLFEFPYLIITKTERNVGVHLPTGIADKNDCIGLYFTALDVGQFIVFLEFHNYPKQYIEQIKLNSNNLSHIRFDVGIDVFIENDKLMVKKTSFYGSF